MCADRPACSPQEAHVQHFFLPAEVQLVQLITHAAFSFFPCLKAFENPHEGSLTFSSIEQFLTRHAYSLEGRDGQHSDWINLASLGNGLKKEKEIKEISFLSFFFFFFWLGHLP